jgi:hypothetical protein
MGGAEIPGVCVLEIVTWLHEIVGIELEFWRDRGLERKTMSTLSLAG